MEDINKTLRNKIIEYYFKRLSSKLFNWKGVSLDSISEKSISICPSYKIEAITPYYKVEHENRIFGGRNINARDVIEKTLNRKEIEFREVKVHKINYAVLNNGSVYCKDRKIELRHISEQKIDLKPRNKVVEIDKAALVDSSAGSTWFGHWLLDIMPAQLLTSKLAEGLGYCREEYQHEFRYREIFRLEKKWKERSAVIRNLYIVDDFAQNPSKTLRYHELKKRMRQNFSSKNKNEKRVFLKRGKTGVTRELSNENEIASVLEKQGYICVDVSSPLDVLLEALFDADVVISTEGSHLAHSLYAMKKNGTMIILTPPYLVHTTVADVGVFLGILSGLFVCEIANAAIGSFYADIDEMLNFIDDTLNYSKETTNRLNDYVEKVLNLCPKNEYHLYE